VWYIWYSVEGIGRGRSPPRPLLAVPNVIAYSSTASVPITVLLYSGLLFCGFNVPIKWIRVFVHYGPKKSPLFILPWFLRTVTNCYNIWRINRINLQHNNYRFVDFYTISLLCWDYLKRFVSVKLSMPVRRSRYCCMKLRCLSSGLMASE